MVRIKKMKSELLNDFPWLHGCWVWDLLDKQKNLLQQWEEEVLNLKEKQRDKVSGKNCRPKNKNLNN